MADVAAPVVPSFLPLFFPLNGVVNYDSVTLLLLIAQITELAYGFFLAPSFN